MNGEVSLTSEMNVLERFFWMHADQFGSLFEHTGSMYGADREAEEFLQAKLRRLLWSEIRRRAGGRHSATKYTMHEHLNVNNNI